MQSLFSRSSSLLVLMRSRQKASSCKHLSLSFFICWLSFDVIRIWTGAEES